MSRGSTKELSKLVAALAVCALTAYAQTSPAAHLRSLTGQVSVLRDSTPWALSVGDAIEPSQIILSGSDGFAIFEVSDGSTFEVFPNSRVVFRDNRSNWKDLLEVLIGRVKIHIQKIGGQPNYNKVRTPTAVISVRGTTFDVSVEDEDATTLVMVEEGLVAVQHSLLPRGDAKLLSAGEWIRVYKNQPLAAKTVDRGGVLRTTLRAAADAMYGILYRTSRDPQSTGGTGTSSGSTGGGTSTGGSGSGTGGVGDKGSGTPPPPPPPPPPPHH